MSKNEVVECLAIVGDWLQVRHNDEEAAWMRWRTKKVDGSDIFNVLPLVIDKKKGKKESIGGDDMFGDNILTYEINGKFVKVTMTPDQKITKEKIAIFDQVRYSGDHADSDVDYDVLLYLLPITIQHLLVEKIRKAAAHVKHHSDHEKEQMVVKFPIKINQSELLDMIINNDNVIQIHILLK